MGSFAFNITAYREGGEHETIAEICRLADAGGVEFWPWAVNELTSSSEVERIARVYADEGVAVDTYHLPFGPELNPAHPCEDKRREAVDIFLARLEKITALGVRAAILHPDGESNGNSVEDRNISFRQLGKSLEALLPAAKAAGMGLALENMPPSRNCFRFSAYPEYMARIAETFDHPQLGFCLDTGHAAMVDGLDGARAWFDAMGLRILAFHLHDNPGDRDLHLAPGHGLFDWSAFFRRAAAMGFTGRMTIEAPPFAPGPPYTVEAWRLLVRDTSILAAAAVAPATQPAGSATGRHSEGSPQEVPEHSKIDT